MFPKVTPPMPKGNWKASLAFSPTSTTKLSTNELKPRGGTAKPQEKAKPKTKHKNGNTKREINKKTAEEVRARDKFCIIPKCGMQIEENHHAFYWAESNYGKDRNEAHQLVWLCKNHHDQLHSRGWNDLRQFCKDYLKQYAQV